MIDMIGGADVTWEDPITVATFDTYCDQARGWPRPGEGATVVRFDHLTSLAQGDLTLGRLVEAHADALAISAEVGDPTVTAAGRWAVWAAGPAERVVAAVEGGSWRLRGTKDWCSGATLVDHALVDAATVDGQRLFAVDLSQPEVAAAPPSWVGPGMRRSDTRSVAFDRAFGIPLGGPGEYLSRPGFWSGAVGVAACWHGGSITVATTLFDQARTHQDPHLLAHLGAVHVALSENRSVLAAAAHHIDSTPHKSDELFALTVRSTVEQNATEIIGRAGRALGPAPLAHLPLHSATVADLAVYIRQHHGDRDLAEIGQRLSEQEDRWSA
jgi:alkylation response protein AidB-like acyl-CoA dehydrogenase